MYYSLQLHIFTLPPPPHFLREDQKRLSPISIKTIIFIFLFFQFQLSLVHFWFHISYRFVHFCWPFKNQKKMQPNFHQLKLRKTQLHVNIFIKSLAFRCSERIVWLITLLRFLFNFRFPIWTLRLQTSFKLSICINYFIFKNRYHSLLLLKCYFFKKMFFFVRLNRRTNSEVTADSKFCKARKSADNKAVIIKHHENLFIW